MATEKIIKSRIVNKHATYTNWSQATGFTPKQGEILVFEPNANATDDKKYYRLAVGDGVTKASALNCITVTPEELEKVVTDLANNLAAAKKYTDDELAAHTSLVNNPHHVTAALVGLGSVTNVATTATISNGSTQNITSGAVYTALAGKEPTITKKTAFNKDFETSTANIKANGAVSVGTSTKVARSDHVHPTDTTRAAASVVEAHTTSTNNPHKVTKAQVGLGNVTNVATTSTLSSGSTQNITSGAVYSAIESLKTTEIAAAQTAADNAQDYAEGVAADLEAEVARAEGAENTLTNAVQTAQSTANAAKNAADTAQSTADAVKSDLATYKTTVSTTYATKTAMSSGDSATLEEAKEYTDSQITSHTHSLDSDKITDGTTYVKMTATERTKLQGIATGANKITVDTALSTNSANPVQNQVVTAKLNEKANAADVYTTQQVDDKLALKSDSTHTHSSYVNKNAFAKVTIGSTTVSADAVEDTLTLVAGSNITLTPDSTNDKITIAATNTQRTLATANPLMDGTAAVGTSSKVAREDHVHPSDTSKADVATLEAHTNSTDNPHGVTKSQVGLGSVSNYAISSTYTSSGDNYFSRTGAYNMYTDLTGKIDGKSASGHTHDDRYYTEDEVDALLATKSSTTHTHSSYVNQNAFSNVKVGTTTVAADTATDTLELVAGSNVTITPDSSGDKITIAAKDTVYTHPTHSSASEDLYKVTVDTSGHVTKTTKVTAADIEDLGVQITDTHHQAKLVVSTSTTGTSDSTGSTVYLNVVENGSVRSYTKLDAGSNVTIKSSTLGRVQISATNTTYNVATQIANGLMSSGDKKTVDTLAGLLGEDTDSVVNKIDEVLSAFENYPEANKVVEDLANKSNKGHTHSVTAAGTVGSKSITPAGTVKSKSITPAGTVAITSTASTTGNYTPAGSVSATFTGTASTISVKHKPAGTVSKPTFTGTKSTISVKGTPSGSVSVTATNSTTGNYTPAGSITASFTGTAAEHNHTFTGNTSTFTGSYTPVGTISVDSGTANYTPEGTVASSFSGTAGTTTSISGSTKVASSGHKHNVTAAGTVAIATEESTETYNYTPTGTVSTPTVTVTLNTSSAAAKDHKHAITAAGTISQPTFTGTGVELKATFTGTAATSGAASTKTTVVTGASATATTSSVTGTAASTTGTTSVYSITGVGSLPTYSATVSDAGVLSFTFGQGSLPTRSSVTVASSGHTHSVTGTAAAQTITVTTSTTQVASSNHTHSVTAKGTIAISTGTGTPNYTPVGTVSQPTFTGSQVNTGVPTSTISVATSVKSATASQPTFTGKSANITATFTGTAVTSGASDSTSTVASSNHTHGYTPAGTVTSTFTGTGKRILFTGTASTISVSGKPAGSVGNKSVTPAGTITSTFTGTKVQLGGTFSGNQLTSTCEYTPAGTVSQPTFTGTEATVSTTYTPAGTISASFAGTKAQINATFTGTAASHDHTFEGTAASHDHTFTGSSVTSGGDN